jgi:hypothetical protein
MFPTDDWDSPPTLGWEISLIFRQQSRFWLFCGIGTLLDYPCSSPGKKRHG